MNAVKECITFLQIFLSFQTSFNRLFCEQSLHMYVVRNKTPQKDFLLSQFSKLYRFARTFDLLGNKTVD
jgi:hypothetical protein